MNPKFNKFLIFNVGQYLEAGARQIYVISAQSMKSDSGQIRSHMMYGYDFDQHEMQEQVYDLGLKPRIISRLISKSVLV